MCVQWCCHCPLASFASICLVMFLRISGESTEGSGGRASGSSYALRQRSKITSCQLSKNANQRRKPSKNQIRKRPSSTPKCPGLQDSTNQPFTIQRSRSLCSPLSGSKMRSLDTVALDLEYNKSHYQKSSCLKVLPLVPFCERPCSEGSVSFS